MRYCLRNITVSESSISNTQKGGKKVYICKKYLMILGFLNSSTSSPIWLHLILSKTYTCIRPIMVVKHNSTPID